MDARTDVWSFGCVLYEMLTNQQAFQGETMADVWQTLSARTWSILAHRTDTPTELERIIAKTSTQE